MLECLNYECDKALSESTIRDILTSNGQSELYEKYLRFLKQKELDSDPLVRWCPKPQCGHSIRAENEDAQKLVCSHCRTEVCFKCRDVWHEFGTTCEEAM